MRKYFIIIFSFLSLIINATDYFIKTGGNDLRRGTSDGNAWSTIEKVNSYWEAGFFIPGDNIFFKRGDTFYGTIHVSESGIPGAPITIGAYGTGDDPVITGFTAITPWAYEGAGIYSNKIYFESKDSIIVSVDNVNTAIGRFPNSGFLNIDSHVGTNNLTDADLNSAIISWTGAEVVVRAENFFADRLPILDHKGSTLTFPPAAGNDWGGYFIQNDLQTLDTIGEWFYNGNKFYMYFGTVDPTTKTVKVSLLKTGLRSVGYDYITIQDLIFIGYGGDGLKFADSRNITINNCSISFIGQTGIKCDNTDGGSSPNCLIDNNVFNEINNDGIYLGYQFTEPIVSNNTLTNIGLRIGSSFFHGPYWTAYCGIVLFSVNPLDGRHYPNPSAMITYNYVSNTGYSGIQFFGRNVTVRCNYVSSYCVELTDGGGIYTYADYNDDPTVKNYVRRNIVLGAKGHQSSINESAQGANGIYIDGYSIGVTVDSNTVSGGKATNLLINGNRFGIVRDNTLFNAWYNIYISKFTRSSPDIHEGLILKNNYSICKEPMEFCFVYTGSDDISPTVSLDSNYYSKPVKDYPDMYYWVPPGIQYYMNILQWLQFRMEDQNSHIGTTRITTDSSAIELYYNATKEDSIVTFSEPMIDIVGKIYPISITLPPYSSKVLIKYAESRQEKESF